MPDREHLNTSHPMSEGWRSTAIRYRFFAEHPLRERTHRHAVMKRLGLPNDAQADSRGEALIARLDFSDKAAQAMYEFETFGLGNLGTSIFSDRGERINGYAYGKRMQDINLSLWRTGIEQGLSCKAEFLYDPDFAPIRAWLEDQMRHWIAGPLGSFANVGS